MTSETQLPYTVTSNNYRLTSCGIVHIYPLTLCSLLLSSFLKLFVPFIFAGVVLHSEKADISNVLPLLRGLLPEFVA